MNGLICDNCGTVLALDSRNGNEAASGEDSAWIVIQAGGCSVDACTRSCAIAMLDDGGTLQPVIDSYLAMISEIAATVREGHEADDDAGDEGDKT